ncbi:hypothetical protein VNO78_23199 [Psophocarpus tetragonolobus]|uniref:Uncharacterized protein n=1 Tax=Psophocarpus tetragonolobus TaxID=3891 RepID=A0AAN9S688_PSOTE
METPRIHQNQRVHTTQPNPLSLSSMAQLDQNLCRRKKNKKERKNGKQKKEKLDVFKCPPTKPTLHLSFSLSLSSKPCSPNYPSASPQKIPSSSLVFQKNNIFHRVMWAFWVSLSRSEFLTEKTGKREPSYPFTSSLFLGPLFSYFFPSRFVPSPLTPPHPPSSFSLSAFSL